MREIINVHLGQAGTQLAESCWQLYCLEHGIGNDGLPLNDRPQSTSAKTPRESFFMDTGMGRYVPRALFIDSEPSVIDTMQRGALRGLFNPRYLMTGSSDAANNYARGYNVVGPPLVDDSVEKLRRMAESCDSLQGFVLSHASAGGTGSGTAARLLEQLSGEFPHKCRLQLVVAPSPKTSSVVVEPYNVVLHTHATLDTVDCTFLVDNEALYRVCQNELAVRKPSHAHANRVAAQSLTSIMTSVSGGDGQLNELHSNLVPYPKMHFTSVSFSPFVAAEDAVANSTTITPTTTMAANNNSDNNNDIGSSNNDQRSSPQLDTRQRQREELTAAQLTQTLFEDRSRLLSCDFHTGRYIACSLLFRGDINQQEIHETLTGTRMLKKVPVINWCPATFKVGIQGHPPAVQPYGDLGTIPRAGCLVGNSTALKSVWKNLLRKFRMLYSKKAFVHWYMGEGLELSEMSGAYEQIRQLEQEYIDLECSQDSSQGPTDGI